MDEADCRSEGKNDNAEVSTTVAVGKTTLTTVATSSTSLDENPAVVPSTSGTYSYLRRRFPSFRIWITNELIRIYTYIIV